MFVFFKPINFETRNLRFKSLLGWTSHWKNKYLLFHLNNGTFLHFCRECIISDCKVGYPWPVFCRLIGAGAPKEN